MSIIFKDYRCNGLPKIVNCVKSFVVSKNTYFIQTLLV